MRNAFAREAICAPVNFMRIVLGICVCILTSEQGIAQSPMIEMRFGGKALGGQLLLGLFPFGHSQYVCIETRPGEDATQVIQRLQKACVIAESEWFRAAVVKESDDYTLELPLHAGFFLAGTETGLGILASPLYVSARYDKRLKQVYVYWHRQSGADYDGIIVLPYSRWTFQSYDPSREEFTIQPDLDEIVGFFEEKPDSPHIAVIGRKDGLVTNAASIVLSGSRQEELENIPFTGDIAPNWRAWFLEKDDLVILAQGTKRFEVDGTETYDGPGAVEIVSRYGATQEPDYISHPAQKVFYQSLRCSAGRCAPGGIYRQFLGLVAGHTYRLYVRLNTYKANEAAGTWEYSLHACLNDTAGSELTPEQLAGIVPLPDGSIGSDAGLIVRFRSGGPHTCGKWYEVSTGAKNRPNGAKDFTIPEGVDSISVWLRLQADRPEEAEDLVEVGMDWICLEDITESVQRPAPSLAEPCWDAVAAGKSAGSNDGKAPSTSQERTIKGGGEPGTPGAAVPELPRRLNTLGLEDGSVDGRRVEVQIEVRGSGRVKPDVGIYEVPMYRPQPRGCASLCPREGPVPPGCEECEYNVITVSAEAMDGWLFRAWQGSTPLNGRAEPQLDIELKEDMWVVAEFVERPGVAELDLAEDLRYFLSVVQPETTVETFDRNEIDYDGDGNEVFVGNGIPDAAEFCLVQGVLKRPALDLSARSGVVHGPVWRAWQHNLKQARADLSAQGDERFIRAVAAYMTLGGFGTCESAKELVERTFPNVLIEVTAYDRSRNRFFDQDEDADNDGLSNRDEWDLASPDGRLVNMDVFVEYCLNGKRDEK